MDREIRDQWVKALLSEDYIQGNFRLRKKGKFCCLGVLCELHRLATNGPEWTKPDPDIDDEGFGYHGTDEVLPKVVREWANLEDNDPHCEHPYKKGHGGETLSNLNDSGFDFDEIAEVIGTQF